jgi:magnesium transporter
MTLSRHYRDGRLVSTGFSLDELDEKIAESKSFVWFDLKDPSPAEIQSVQNELNLHILAIEDSLRGRQRAKLEHYDSHLFLSLYQAKFNKTTLELELAEMAVFVTKNAVITVRRGDDFDIDAVQKRWDESSELAQYGAAFLLWGILDVVLDEYFDVIQVLDDELESLEDILFDAQQRDSIIQKRSYGLRKALVLLRRAAVPMREVINPLLKHNGDILHNDMMPYYQDLYDHTMRVADWTDSLRDLVTTLLETNLTLQGNRMNMVMKKVTSWAAIIAVPTAITGFYGQNVPYPGFDTAMGFWVSSGLIVAVSGLLYLVFKKRDWL